MSARFHRPAIVALALLLAVGCTEQAHRTEAESAREIAGDLSAHGAFARAEGFDLLFVTLDTVRADHLGCYGHEGAATPVLDALASRGVRFEQAMATAPITLPSHSSIMTGLYTPAHGARDNGYFRLGDGTDTLAETLSAQGYATAAFIGAYVLDRRYGLAQGFEHYDDAVVPTALGETTSGYNERRADAVTDGAVAWLEGHLDAPDPRPYFLWVHYFDPHWPYEPPPPFDTRFGGRPYDGEIAFVDMQVGRLVDLLEREGRLERTLVVVTADHGEGLGEHGETTHTLFIYDSTLRVPWILSCPSLFDGELVVADRVVSLVDVLPTTLDLLGVRHDGAIDGINPFTASPGLDRAVYAETIATLTRHGFAPLHGLRTLHEKYIRAPRPEYYEVATDPGETKNRIAERPELARVLSDRLDAMMAPWEPAVAALDRAIPLDREQAERLAALGYVGSGVPAETATLGDPKDLTPHFNRIQQAKDLSDAGRHDQAIPLIASVVERMPKEPYGWKVAAMLYQRVGRTDRAEQALRRALELQPETEAHVRLAQILVRRGAYDECAEQLDRAEALDPLHGDIYITRGDLYGVKRDYERAIEQFRKAAEVDPIRYGATARNGIAQARARLERGR